MNIKYGKSKRIMASEDYATLRGMDFRKARDILTKDGFHEHEYGDKDDNNGYAVYRKGDKEVELQYRWNQGKRKGEAHAGKVTNVYVDDSVNSACGKKSIKSIKRRGIKASRSKAPRRRMNVMAGPGAGYTIEWELDSIRKVNSFDVVDVTKPDKWGTVTVTADCDVDIDVTIKSAWSYMYGFNHPIEGVSAKIHRVVFDYNISDNYGDLLNFEDYEDLTEDSEYIDEVMNAVYQTNEMDAMNILENEAWETIKGDEFSYGGGWSHSTWDGTILEVDEYNFADIQVTDPSVVEYIDKSVQGETGYSTYTVFIDDDATGYAFDTEEEAIADAKEYIESGNYEGDIANTYVVRDDWFEFYDGDTDLENSEIVWNAFDEYENY